MDDHEEEEVYEQQGPDNRVDWIKEKILQALKGKEERVEKLFQQDDAARAVRDVSNIL